MSPGSTARMSFSKGSAMGVRDDIDEPPLDPAAERLRRKLVRLLAVSGGIMLLGLIAVFAAIVYKVGEAGEAGATWSAASPVAGSIPMPAGSRVVGTSLEGERALITVEAADGATTLLFLDLATGAILGRYTMETQ